MSILKVTQFIKFVRVVRKAGLGWICGRKHFSDSQAAL